MNVLETEWWSIAVPTEWWADREEESIVIGDRDNVGSIEISTLCRESGSFAASEVEALAKDNGEAGWQWSPAKLGEYVGIGTQYLEDGDAVREWYVANGNVVLFVTYSCDAENSGLDDAAVDELLSTLMPLAPAAASD